MIDYMDVEELPVKFAEENRRLHNMSKQIKILWRIIYYTDYRYISIPKVRSFTHAVKKNCLLLPESFIHREVFGNPSRYAPF